MGRTARRREGTARPGAFPKAAPAEIVINSLEDSFQAPRDITRSAATPGFVDAIESYTEMQRPLLIIGIGNKGARYDNTYHNAGIVMLHALRRLELPTHWELWESTTFMNESGGFVKKRLGKWGASRSGGRVVVLQDEMERDVGGVSVRGGWSSARGHNGVKSIQRSLPRDVEWFRVAIGVGRPESRDPTQVANYVLTKMKAQEKDVIVSKAHDVMEELRKISEDAG